MAFSARGTGERTVHQDFIARVRYANTLPPPPNPPKLLEIPNAALGGVGGAGDGYYTTPAFASRLAREQPLNIEADAELGMPLDLIGLPGVFDGDESVIEAHAHPPPVHPHDRALLKPLSSLGKPRTSEAAVSFLRRTEYISSTKAGGGGAVASAAAAAAGVMAGSPLRAGMPIKGHRRPEKRSSPEPDAGTPAFVKRKIEQSFVAAQTAARDRYARVRHPTKKNVRLTGAFPLLPDLGAFPDSGAYVTVKFSHTPVAAGTGVYDTRLLSSLFCPVDQTDEERAALEAATRLWERDPRRHPRPQHRMHYELYLPDQTATGEAFRCAFASSGEDDDSQDALQFTRIRSYESVDEKELTHETKYSEEILLAFADDAAAAAPDLGGAVAGGPGAALYYPVMQRTVVRSARNKQAAAGGPANGGGISGHNGGGAGGESFVDDGGALGSNRTVDRLQVSVHEPPEDMREHIARIRADPLHFDVENDEAEGEAEDMSGNSERLSLKGGRHENVSAKDMDGGRRTNGNGRNGSEEDDEDAEGEEE